LYLSSVGRPLASPAPAELDVPKEPEDEPGSAAAVPTRSRGSELGRLVRTYWLLALLGAVAVGLSLLARHVVYPALSWNRDEPVYLWQMETLRSGHFTTPDLGHPEFFHPWLSAARDGELFSHFTLGWPLALLAADVLFGTPDAALALGALLMVLGTYALARELTRDHGLSLVAAAVMTASPVLLVQGGVYLSYLFTAGLGLVSAAALLSGVRRGRSLRVVGAGLCLGWIFLTRPFDAVLWGLGATAYLLWRRRRRWRTLLPVAGWLALGAAPFLLASFAYNAAVVGGPLSFPNTASDPLDTFGFGDRRIMPGFGTTEFGLVEALEGSYKNVKAFRTFLFGGFLGMGVAAVGIWRVRHDRRLLPLLTLSAAFPIGYLAFWGIHVSSLASLHSSPIYYIPLYATVSILMAVTLRAIWRRWRLAAVGLVAVLALATVPGIDDGLTVNQRISRSQEPLEQAAPPPGRSLVFVEDSGPYLLFTNPFVANDPDMDGRTLYAVDRGPANLDLIRDMPDRTPYSQRLSEAADYLLPRRHPREFDVSYERIRILRGNSVELRVRVRNTVGRPIVVAGVSVGHASAWRTLDTGSALGDTYEATFTVGTGNGSDLQLPDGSDTIAVSAGFGDNEGMAWKTPLHQVRYDYRLADGELEVAAPGEALRAEKSRARRRFVPDDKPSALVVEAGEPSAGGA
jgi:4-amino-4-deoxy-L-arabinose transferase-like glycosyltransferase